MNNSHQVEQLLQEVKIIKNIRHPGVIMHLGIMVVLGTFDTSVNRQKSTQNDNNTFNSCKFFLVSEDYTEYYLRSRKFSGCSSLLKNDYSDSNPLAALIPL